MHHHYNLWIVALSLVVAFLAAYTALDIALRVRDAGARAFRFWFVGGSLALGLGIWSMHFIGMLAHVTPTPLGYDIPLTLWSIVPAIGAASVAIWLVRLGIGERRVIVMGGIVMATGIVAMHYTGMSALRMSPALTYDPLLVAASCGIALAAAMAGLWLAMRLAPGDRWLSVKKLAGMLGLGLAISGMHYTGMAAADFAPGSVSLALQGGLDGSTMAVAVGVGSLGVLMVTLLIALFDARLANEHATARVHLEAEVERRQSREVQLEHLALHDGLTGIANRANFVEQLSLAVRRARRRGAMFGVLAVDLDGFKEINDGFGHATGDALLCDVARRLQAGARVEDTVARLGGDEFSVLATEVASPADLALLAQRLIESLEAAEVGVTGLPAAGSVGIAIYPQDGDDVDDLLRSADFALYHAKSAGKGRYHFFDSQLESRVRTRQRRLDELRLALRDDQLLLHYQPQVDTATGRAVGVEALARWQHPADGLLPPAAFIPLAEEAGLMPAVDAWVIRRACREAADWATQGVALTLALNVSAQSVTPALVTTTIEALCESGLPPRQLEFELTETALLNAEDTGVVDVLQQLAALGVGLSIDDFGTGYGSLLYLRSLPIAAIKIDRRFVQAAPGTAQDAAIVKSLLDLGRTLELRVVAEGVETAEQLALLRELGCETAQGYFFSPPVPGAEAVRHGRSKESDRPGTAEDSTASGGADRLVG